MPGRPARPDAAALLDRAERAGVFLSAIDPSAGSAPRLFGELLRHELALAEREIGTVLQLSLNTVKTHGRLLFRKLGVSSRAEAVARARELGLL